MTERWEKMAKKAASEWEGPDTQAFAAKLLARQHQAFVRMVKKLPRTLCTTTRGQMFEAVSLNELLAALAKRKGGGG